MKSIIEKIKSLDKKIFIFLGVFLLIILLGIGVSKIIYLVGNSNKSYSEVESILKKAGQDYYRENTSSLPKEDGNSVSVGDTVLSDGGYMKSLDKLIKKSTCTGKVTVTKEKDLYNYAAYLDCGKDYKTSEFYKKLEKEVTTSGDGLYEVENGYAYRGENPNNYLSIEGKLWRIISIEEDNTIEAVFMTPITYVTWDDRYNSAENYKSGYNNFENSRLNDVFNDIYKGKISYEKNTTVITNTMKNLLVPVNNCVDKYKETATNFSSCQNKNDKFVSIISIGEYIRASLDSKCKSPKNKECQNYNYLVTKEEFWTLTANADSKAEVYMVLGSGAIDSTTANDMENIYPVIRLSNKTMYAAGKGTIEDPFIIR